MCVMLTDHEPNTTKLIQFPAVIDGVKYNACIYINNIDTESRPALMVVPFPKSDVPIGMIDMSSKTMKKFVKEVKARFPRPENMARNFSAQGMTNKSLAVHKVGNYNISIAPTFMELSNDIDWDKFDKPADFQQRINTFKNKILYPLDYCFVVAQAVYSVKEDGFGILYPNIGVDYFPTAHEDINNIMDYDVECYHFTNLKGTDINFGNRVIHVHTHNDKNDIDNLLSHIDNRVKMDNGLYTKFIIPENIRNLNMWKINGKNKNKNMHLKNEKWYNMHQTREKY